MKSRITAVLVVLGLALAAGLAWHRYWSPELDTEADSLEGDWLTDLHSANPKTAEAAAAHLRDLGAAALPEIQDVLRDPSSDPATLKAAMKAAGLLGPVAAPVIPDIASRMAEPGLTAEAAVALSYLGRGAFVPLKESLESEDPGVRQESLRSLGKLRERAPLESRTVVPLLLEGLEDPDPGVRTVAATYLGIIGTDSDRAVPALIGALKDPEPEVRIAVANALGSFPDKTAKIIPALRRASRDPNADVAREAGLAIVKLQGSGPPK